MTNSHSLFGVNPIMSPGLIPELSKELLPILSIPIRLVVFLLLKTSLFLTGATKHLSPKDFQVSALLYK